MFLTHLNNEYSVLHYPGRCLDLGGVDPVLEDHEIQRGFVYKKDAEVCLTRRNLDWKASLCDKHIMIFQQLSSAAKASTALPEASVEGLYMCQGTFNTYGKGMMIEANIPCIE